MYSAVVRVFPLVAKARPVLGWIVSADHVCPVSGVAVPMLVNAPFVRVIVPSWLVTLSSA